MSEVRKRLILTFTQKIAFRDWLVANHKYICDQNMSRGECCEEAMKTLGFSINVGHLPEVVRTIPDLTWPFTSIAGPSNARQEDIDTLREQMQLMDIGVTDINTKIAELQSQYVSLSKEVTELRSSLDGRLTSLDAKTRTATANINALAESVIKMQQSLDMAMTELGFVKLDKELKKVVATAASAQNHRPR